MDEDVPLLIPEVNHEHLGLWERQRRRYPSGGYIVTNPNCSTIMIALALACCTLRSAFLKQWRQRCKHFRAQVIPVSLH
jgi:aspartate-semialdehyde dehydrogenase